MSAGSGRIAARFEYDGLFRRIEKEVTNQGLGIVHGSDASGAEGILAGDRFERYYYAGWWVVELCDNAETNRTAGQLVYSTQYIDEPICYDRDTDGDDDCLEAEDSRRYFYHQDASDWVQEATAWARSAAPQPPKAPGPPDNSSNFTRSVPRPKSLTETV